VQTSSYGTPIPRIFGTMRVAGSVIWSTDLIETRSKSSGGKGQPTVTNYSYSASFAVLLSARAIQGVGRIWADGKLLRGSAGDFKSQTDFRLHAGSEDQPVDPLIAAAEGAGLAPAHRGLAYAVFENFQLADYGNRMPPGPASSLLIDCINSVEVDLLHPLMALGPADDAALDHGANLALIGGELIQFGSAMPIEPRRWRLARLRRGLRGTEAAIGGQMAGDRFLLIDAETMIAADLPLSAIGGTATVLASGVGDRPGPARADAAITGASVLPPSPAQVRARRLANGDVTITWVRRSRLGWRWIDAVDAPLGEESERYSVVVITAGARSVIERDRPEVTLPAAMIADGTVISIRQLGNAGESAPASITLTI
jgi:hypothetical protein